ncbi:hypothetical protein, partial [Burkholderia pseudomallei]|uniref:hypothetical protein n=1 Tax=Burkholderia pseudomallei TaxID=28450 RepID=UPI001C71A252
QLQTETATPSRPRFVIEEVTTGSVLLCAIRREVAQISNAFDNENKRDLAVQHHNQADTPQQEGEQPSATSQGLPH